LQYLETIAASPSFQSILKDGGRRPDPKSYVKDLKAAKDYIRSSAISMWHYVGTCSMLPREKGGVVDDHLTVYGTSNLRVVDASIMPLISRANTQSTVYAVAERAADLIKAKHGLTTISSPRF
jgi:choline dehydrogenase-like flavoprotein